MTGSHRPLSERFWMKVDIRGPDECWPWLAARTNRGYGVIGRGRAAEGLVLAHRLSMELHLGRPPIGDVCHHCDNPPCVNPAHLFEGTASDNLRDMVTKGRNYHVTRPGRVARGERNNHAKLTAADVLAIRQSVEGSVALGRRYGVDRHTIAKVRARQSWTHVH